MRRRMAVAALVAIGLFAGGGAGAQTTTTTSSTTTPVVILTTSTSTTSTTVVNPCTGQPCTDLPPVATLAGSAGDVRLESFDYCWRLPTPVPGQGLVTRCAIGTPAPEASVPVGLVVRRGERLTLRFAITMAPTEVLLQRGDVPGVAPVALTAANPTSFVADLPVGTYFVNFRTKWNQGDVSYRLKIEVRAATASEPRVIALTG